MSYAGRLNIVSIAAECEPFTGRRGIGRVVRKLAEAMAKAASYKHHGGPACLRVIIPRHQSGDIDYHAFEPYTTIQVTSEAWGVQDVQVFWAEGGLSNLQFFAIDCGPAFNLGSVPGAHQQMGGRSMAIKYAFFCMACVRLMQQWWEDPAQTGKTWPIDVIHLHDWPAGLVAALIEKGHSAAGWWPMWDDTKIWWTCHDSPDEGEQGHFDSRSCGWSPQEFANLVGLLPRAVQRAYPNILLDPDTFSFQAAAINYAWRGGRGCGINALSSTHAYDLAHSACGGRAQRLLEGAPDDRVLTGILNGIDLDEYHPGNPRSPGPPLTPEDGSVTVIDQKHNRQQTGLAALLRDQVRGFAPETAARVGAEFDVADDDFLLVAPHAITEQAGLDLFAHESVADALLDAHPSLKVIFAGDAGDSNSPWARPVSELADRRPDRVLYIQCSDDDLDDLESLLLTYADALLMPSRWEPCGVTQMAAMRYCCVPLAHRTGGLKDTIIDVRDWRGKQLDPEGATGFLFEVDLAYDRGNQQLQQQFDSRAREALLKRAGDMLECYAAYRGGSSDPWPTMMDNAYTWASRNLSWQARASEYLNRFRACR